MRKGCWKVRAVQGLQGPWGPQGTAGGLQEGCGERSNGGLGYTSYTSYWAMSGEDYRHYTLYELWASELESKI